MAPRIPKKVEKGQRDMRSFFGGPRNAQAPVQTPPQAPIQTPIQPSVQTPAQSTKRKATEAVKEQPSEKEPPIKQQRTAQQNNGSILDDGDVLTALSDDEDIENEINPNNDDNADFFAALSDDDAVEDELNNTVEDDFERDLDEDDDDIVNFNDETPELGETEKPIWLERGWVAKVMAHTSGWEQ